MECAISTSDRDEIQAQFLNFASDQADDRDGDPDWYRQVADDLEFVAERLGLDVTPYTDRLNERASEAESERAETSPALSEEREWERSPSGGDEAHEMFESLRAELES